MNTIETNKVRLACPTCGISEITSKQDDYAVKYFAIQRDDSLGTIKKAICRTCASAAIIQEHHGD